MCGVWTIGWFMGRENKTNAARWHGVDRCRNPFLYANRARTAAGRMMVGTHKNYMHYAVLSLEI